MKVKILALALAGCLLIPATGCQRITIGGDSSSEAASSQASGWDEAPKYDFDLAPYVTLGEYKGVSYSYTEPSVTQEELEAQIRKNMKSAGVTETQEVDRAAQLGDTLNIAFTGYMDGEAFSGGSSDDYDLELGSGSFIDGFEEGLVGKKAGEEITLDLNFPDPYPNQPAYSGLPVQFRVTIHSVTETIYPALTDELASEMSDGAYETAKEYQNYVTTSLLADKTEDATAQMKEDIWDTILSNCTLLGYPDNAVSERIDYMTQRYQSYATQLGFTWEQYLQFNNMSEDDYAKLVEQYAQEDIYEEMVKHAIARAEGIEPLSDEAFDEAAEDYANHYGYDSVSMLVEYVGYQTLKQQIIFDKVDALVEDSAVPAA